MPKDSTPKQIDKVREAAHEQRAGRPEEPFNAIEKQIAKAKHAPFDEMVARAGKGAVVRSTKPLKPRL